MSREIKRNIARRLMEMSGVKRINKKDKENPLRTDQYGNTMKASYFSLHWRQYLDPDSVYRKALNQQLTAMTNRYNRAHGTNYLAPWPVSKYGSDVYRKDGRNRAS